MKTKISAWKNLLWKLLIAFVLAPGGVREASAQYGASFNNQTFSPRDSSARDWTARGCLSEETSGSRLETLPTSTFLL